MMDQQIDKARLGSRSHAIESRLNATQRDLGQAMSENEIKCQGCGNRESHEDVEVRTAGKKQYWICPECFFENPIVNGVVTPRKRAKKASET